MDRGRFEEMLLTWDRDFNISLLFNNEILSIAGLQTKTSIGYLYQTPFNGKVK
jgi:hypothetical protein